MLSLEHCVFRSMKSKLRRLARYCFRSGDLVPISVGAGGVCRLLPTSIKNQASKPTTIMLNVLVFSSERAEFMAHSAEEITLVPESRLNHWVGVEFVTPDHPSR